MPQDGLDVLVLAPERMQVCGEPPVLEAVLVTASGKETEKLGIATRWDVLQP